MLLPPATLRLAFDRPDRRYAAGETVRGRILMTVTSGFRCTRLDVGLSFATHGKGDVDKAFLAGVTLAAEAFFAPGSTEIPFELPIPAGATPTYRGSVLNLDWYVHAQADVSLAIDPKVTEDILVVAPSPVQTAEPPSAFSTLLVHHPGVETPAFTPTERGFTMSSGTSAVVGLAIAGVPLVGLLVDVAQSWGTGKGLELGRLSMFGIILVPFGLYMFATSMMKVLAKAALRRLEIHVGPVLTPGIPAFRRGCPLACVAFVATEGRARVEKVKLRLVARERTKKGSGTREQVFTEDHRLDGAEIAQPYTRQAPHFDPYRQGRADAGDPFAASPAVSDGCAEYRALLSVPWNAPTPFDLGNNSLQWQLHVVVVLANAPDWDERYDLNELR